MLGNGKKFLRLELNNNQEKEQMSYWLSSSTEFGVSLHVHASDLKSKNILHKH